MSRKTRREVRMNKVTMPEELERRLLSTTDITGIPAEDLLREAVQTWCDCMLLGHWADTGALDLDRPDLEPAMARS